MVDAVLPASFSLIAGIGGALAMSGTLPANQSITVNYGEASTPSEPDAANLRVFLDGDDIDGAANTTLTNGSAFASWLNKGTLGGTFAQATGANQPLFFASLLNGHGGAKFDGSNDRLVSSLTASAFTFLHDGSGCTVYVVVRTSTSAVQTIMATRTAAGASRGLMVGTNTLARPQVVVSDGATTVATVTGASSSLPSGQFSIFATRLALAGSPDLRVNVNAGSVGSVDATGFSASAPAATLGIGSNATPGSFFNGDVLAVMTYAADHDTTTFDAVRAYLATKYAATFPA